MASTGAPAEGGSTLARRFARAGIVLAAVVVALVAAAWAVVSQPQFGAPMTGARLQRAMANPQYRDGRFTNLEPETPTSMAALGDYLVRQFSGHEVREPPAPLPMLMVDTVALAAAPPASGLRAFWIGHASTYVEIDGQRLLLDPVFAERVSPLPVGPRRFHPPPIALSDLPKIDAVLISHDHDDHLDMDTVRHLARQGSPFFVPLGIGAHLERWGVPAAQIEELEWWQQRTIGSVRIVCTPTRHYSGRGLRNRSSTLWSSWDVRARRMLPVHWSTFNLAYHDWDEPIRRTVAEAARAGVDVVTPLLGEWVDADRPFRSTRWWESVR